jgi:hypothetical protein
MYYWIDDFDTFCVVEPWSGSSQGEVNNHTVMCFTSPLDPGPHQCNLTIYGGGNGIFTVYVNVTTGGLNDPPDPPTDPLPSNGSTVRGRNGNPEPSDPLPFNGSINSETSPVLSVMVTDPNAEMMTVSFYDASTDSLIGTDYQVMNGTRAYAMWNNLAMNATYSWYAVCHDQENTTQSDTWTFTLMEDSSPPQNVNMPLRMGWNLIGWFPGTNTTAESLGQTINGCTVICMFDGYTQSYTTHVVGIPYNDFAISSGMGLFVYTTINSIWHGEG